MREKNNLKVIAYLPVRDEANNLSKVLESLQKQTFPFSKIILIDDASIDESLKIANKYKTTIIHLTERHPSYLAMPELATIYNKVFEYIDRYNISYNYLMQHGADTILPLNYIEKIVEWMEQNPKLVIASGCTKSEYSVKTHARGSGRLYKAWFWDTYIKRFPVSHIWESYPLYKAQAMGLETRSFSSLEMETFRPTLLYKSLYGYAMRELGYIPIYALARCFKAFLWNSNVGIGMLSSYLRSSSNCYDSEIERFIRSYQTYHLRSLIRNPRTLLRRLIK